MVSQEGLWVNGWTPQGWEVKKQSQGIMMKEITPEDIMGRLGLYIFLFFYPPCANHCFRFYRQLNEGNEGPDNVYLER